MIEITPEIQRMAEEILRLNDQIDKLKVKAKKLRESERALSDAYVRLREFAESVPGPCQVGERQMKCGSCGGGSLVLNWTEVKHHGKCLYVRAQAALKGTPR